MRKSTIWLISGAMLLIAALLLIFYNLREDRQGAEYSEQIVQQLKKIFPNRKALIFRNFPRKIYFPVMKRLLNRFSERKTGNLWQLLTFLI